MDTLKAIQVFVCIAEQGSLTKAADQLGYSRAMVTQLLLKWNGYQFQLEQNELADMFIGIADGTKDETELRYWINDHIE
jgi:hypothetical protein